MSFSPHVDDYRIAKVANEEGKHWIWGFDIDGSWVFVVASDEQAAGQFAIGKTHVGEDNQYDYWRVQKGTQV